MSKKVKRDKQRHPSLWPIVNHLLCFMPSAAINYKDDSFSLDKTTVTAFQSRVGTLPTLHPIARQIAEQCKVNRGNRYFMSLSRVAQRRKKIYLFEPHFLVHSYQAPTYLPGAGDSGTVSARIPQCKPGEVDDTSSLPLPLSVNCIRSQREMASFVLQMIKKMKSKLTATMKHNHGQACSSSTPLCVP
ncbi:hypothetical protein L249_0094, partial [Ophiocordyceps polyrhachis-furcata BCC 54312]